MNIIYDFNYHGYVLREDGYKNILLKIDSAIIHDANKDIRNKINSYYIIFAL